MDQTYTFPNRFGTRGLLLITGIFGLASAVTKGIQADLRMIAPVLAFVVLICLAQMLFGNIPRIASASVGAVVFPAATYIDPIFAGQWRLQYVSSVDLFWLVVCGSLAGYLGGVLLAGFFLIADYLQQDSRGRVYRVPHKFGTGTILLATTLFAMLFAFLKWAEARPAELFFYTSFVASLAVAQMILPRTPRWASIAAGGFFLPLSIRLFGRVSRWWMLPRIEDLLSLLVVVTAGALVGYLGGALIAGVFLISDYAVKLYHGHRRRVLGEPAGASEVLPTSPLSLLAQQAAAGRER